MKKNRVPSEVFIKDPLLEAIDQAYLNLSPTEAEEVDKICDQLIANVKNRKYRYGSSNIPAMFGFTSALELTAKLGIFLNGKVPPKPDKETDT